MVMEHDQFILCTVLIGAGSCPGASLNAWHTGENCMQAIRAPTFDKALPIFRSGRIPIQLMK